MRITLALALAAVVLVLGCGSAQPHAASPARSATRPAPAAVPASSSSHVAVIVMENKEAAQVVGSPQAPYLTRLAGRYAYASRSYGVTHPSLPNYLALTSGATHGITSDCTACHVAAPNLAAQLDGRGISWKSYLQGMPRPCYGGARSGRYAKKHNPFMYYDDVARQPSRCGKLVPYPRLLADLRAARLPAFSFIAPDLCADTHDCGVRTGDQFLAALVPQLLRGIGPSGFVVVTYDEGTTNAGCCAGSRGGRIATVVAGPQVRRGYRLTTPVDHYGVLATIEDAFGLPLLGRAADPRSGRLDAMFTRPPRLG